MMFQNKKRFLLALAVFISLGVFALYRNQTDAVPVPEDETVSYEKNDAAVHIAGEVMHPGVYEIHEGERLNEVIERAGGLTADADDNRLNLSLRLKDEDKIVIPSINEETTVQSFVMSEIPKVNLNTASIEELKTLSGIGDAMAERIMDYREKSRFTRIEDLMNVPGIGEKTFENLRDKVTVD